MGFGGIPVGRHVAVTGRIGGSARAIAIAGLCAVAVGCGGRQAAGPQAPPPTLVRTAEVRQVAVEDSSDYVATIQSLSSTLIKPEVTGELRAILVSPGDRVQPKTMLFQIDPARQQATLSSQDAARAAQVASTTFAKQQLDRARALLQAGAGTQQDLDQAQANYDAAVSQLNSLDARVQQERVTLGYYGVRAPSAGRVGDIPVRVGMHVTSDTVLTTIDRNEDLDIDVSVPLQHAADLKVGLPVEVLGPDGAILARTALYFVSLQVDDQTQSVLVKAKVPAMTGLRSSQFVRARIIWRTRPGLTVPVLAVVRINGQPFVFVAEPKGGSLTVRQQRIDVGEIIGDSFEVLGGLSAGQQIVVSGAQKLGSGMRIRTS
jgi:RND family efflux transporter MFP subunit